MDNLLDYRKVQYSTIGNDGIIDYIFNKLGIKNGTFVEFGAWDGIKNSNCRQLFKNGWRGVFIESDYNKYIKLKSNYQKYNEKIKCINSKIGFKENILFDTVISSYINNSKIDFCSIDIDGLDLEVFETFKKYMPIVICIEGGQMLFPFAKKISKKIARYNIGQSLKVMINSFEQKGYKILCSYQDCFFIKKEFYYLFNVSEDILTLYFDGLRAFYKRCPFIQKYMKKVDLKNRIVDYILKKSDFKKYGWKNRKKWAQDQVDIISRLIDKRENIERNIL
jgi:hypothetical protein